jgi:hypothetical protein
MRRLKCGNLQPVNARVLVTCAACLAGIVACAVPKRVYPDSWPQRLTSDSACRHLDGRYENLAVASTGYRPEKYPELGDTYLSGLLQNGVGWAPEALRAGGSEVAFSASKLSAEIRVPGSSAQPLQSERPWTCEPSGDLVIRFEAPVQSEWVLAETRTIILTIQRASDRSLVVHQDRTYCGWHFSVLPACTEEDDWLRFRSIN